MQAQDTATVVSLEKARAMLPLPYKYEGLTVEGVSRDRLTPRMNENITVPDEVGRAIVARNLARRLTESRIAIALVGLGLRPAALTVAALVRATITTAGLARLAANTQSPVTSTPKPAHPSEDIEVELHIPGIPAIPLEGYETDQPFEVEL